MARGMVDLPGTRPVEQTVEHLLDTLRAKGLTLFALVDHSGEAAKAGLTMPPTRLVIFGNATAGTPLMLAAPRVAIDLPLKILVWQDTAGKCWVSYNTPEYLLERHGFPAELTKNISAVAALAAGAAG